MLCVAAGGTILALAVSTFTLSWTHSVQKTTWWERWEVNPAGLRPIEAHMQGAGAGMEPPDTAIWTTDGWHFAPNIPIQRDVYLGASGATGDGWHLCAAGTCHLLATQAETPVHLWVGRCSAR